jgi:hypothetical protein
LSQRGIGPDGKISVTCQEVFHEKPKNTPINPAFERSSKLWKGYPSETRVKRGLRIVHGEKELFEKLGRNDLCPGGSARRFQKVLHAVWPI